MVALLLLDFELDSDLLLLECLSDLCSKCGVFSLKSLRDAGFMSLSFRRIFFSFYVFFWLGPCGKPVKSRLGIFFGVFFFTGAFSIVSPPPFFFLIYFANSVSLICSSESQFLRISMISLAEGRSAGSGTSKRKIKSLSFLLIC